ncbi:hypothetical protein N510_001309 [Firmicutes bacterium ASF500]|nr:hypothetical protein N510_001309 [Firmicutes bacterium ASF500]
MMYSLERGLKAEYEKDLYDPERVKAREVDRTKTDFARFVLEEWFPICIGLKWGDVDERCSTLTIQRNVVYTPQSGVVVGTPKTANSVRVIHVMQSTLSLLLMLKAQRKRENPGTILAGSLIFPGEAGIFEARDPNAVTRRVKRFMKVNRLPDLSPRSAAPKCQA